MFTQIFCRRFREIVGAKKGRQRREVGKSFGLKPTVAKAFTKALLFLCLRARTGGKVRVEKPSAKRRDGGKWWRRKRKAEVAVDMPVVSAAVNTKII